MCCAKPKSLRAASNLKEKTRIWPGCSGGRKLPYTSPHTGPRTSARRKEEKVLLFLVAFHQLVEWLVQHPLTAATLVYAAAAAMFWSMPFSSRAQT